MAMTPFIGVRISWLIAARKSALARAAASAAVRAFISSWLRRDNSSCSPLGPQRRAQPGAENSSSSGLLDAVNRVQFKRAEFARGVAGCGQRDDPRQRPGRMFLELAQQFQAFRARRFQIHQHQVGGAIVEKLQGLRGGVREAQRDVVVPQGGGQRVQRLWIAAHEQDLR